MQWNTKPFRELYEFLASSDGNELPQPALDLLKELSEDIKSLLSSPKKSDSSRQTLGQGKITIDGTELQLSRKFMETAVQVANELNIDELVSAKLVFYASESAKQLGVSNADAAILLFYFRRGFILDIVRYLLQLKRRGCSLDMTQVLGTAPGVLVLKALMAVQQGLEDLQERLNHGKFLQWDKNPQFTNLVETQREFLVAEHQSLSCIFYGLMLNNMVSNSVILDTLGEIKEFSSYSSHLLAYILPITTYFSGFANLNGINEPSPSDGDNLFRFFNDTNTTWKLTWWKGGLSLLFATFYASYALKNPNKCKTSYGEVLTMIRSSIDEGGLELLAAITEDTSDSGLGTTYNDFRSVLRNRIPEFTKIGRVISPLILQHLYPVFEQVVEVFISSLGRILQEMRINEEDAYLALSTSDSANTNIRPGVDLERFFMFVCYLYRNRPNASMPFWSNPGSALYGFLTWGSECQNAFISATFTEMLASLSCGEEAANSACKFLSDATPHSKSQFVLNWKSIHDVLVYYIEGLNVNETSYSLFGASKPPKKEPQGPNKLNDETLMVLFSYIRLVGQIGEYSPQARDLAWNIPSDDGKTRNLIQTLFNFLRYQTPLYAPIFSCLSGFVSSNRADELWKLTDTWAFYADVYSKNGEFFFSQASEARFDLLLTNIPEVLGFVSYISKLAQVTNSDHVPASKNLGAYFKFVINDVFVWTNKKDNNASVSDRALAQKCCLSVLDSFLHPLKGQLVLVPPSLGQSLHVDNLVDGEKTTLREYLDAFPYETALDSCFSSPVYETIFAIICTGFENLIDLKDGAVIVKNVISAIEIVMTLLTNNSRDPRRQFDEPTLYNLQIVPHLAMYWTSQHFKLAKKSLDLVRLLDKSELFKALPIRRDRNLCILESFDGSKNVKLGLIEQLDRDDFSLGTPADEELFDVKIGILELIESDLRGRGDVTGQPTMAHFLLGFELHANGNIYANPNVVGGIGSGVSLLQSIGALAKLTLSTMSSDRILYGTSKIAYLCSEILLHLIRDPLSSTLVLDHLRREDDFLLELLKLEPFVDTDTVWDHEVFSGGDFSSEGCADTFSNFFRRRAALVEMVSIEIHVSARKTLLSLVSRYANVLMNLESESSRSVLHFLDFMKFRPSNPPPLPTVQGLVPPTNPNVELTPMKLKTILQVSPTILKNKDEVMEIYKQNAVFTKVKDAQLSCLKSWCQLVPVLVGTRSDGNEQATVTFALETIQTLVPKLIEFSRTDITFCKPLASLLVLLLERYQESHNFSDIAALDRLHGLYKAAVLCIQSSVTYPGLRTDLYVICYQTIQMSLASKSKRVCQEKLDTIVTAGDRLIETICSDTLYANPDLKLVSLILLQVTLALSRHVESTFVQECLIRSNLLSLLVRQLPQLTSLGENVKLGKAEDGNSLDAIKVTLCIFLEIAQNRQGANYLLHSELIEEFSQFRPLSTESIGKQPHYDVYLIIFQVLSAILLSMGSENEKVIKTVRAFIEKHYHLIVLIVRADSAQHSLAPDSPLAKCALAVGRLLALTGYIP